MTGGLSVPARDRLLADRLVHALLRIPRTESFFYHLIGDGGCAIVVQRSLPEAAVAPTLEGQQNTEDFGPDSPLRS